MVYCHDLRNFIAEVVKNRCYHSDQRLQLKVGLDSGGQYLKICLNIYDLENNNNTNELTDTSVKKLFILAIVADTQENHSNMLIMMTKLQLTKPDELPYSIYFANDLKMSNIILGIMGHSSKHPCSWCDISSSDLQNCGNLRSIDSIRSEYNNWCKSGKQMKTAKNFQNCTNNPIFEFQNDVNILDLIPPPELYLLLGITNLLFQKL